MKSNVKYNTFATVLTALVYIALYAGCIATVHDKPAFYTLLSIYIVMIILGLFYGVMYVKADSDNVILGSLFKSSRIPMCRIESVELFRPTMGAIRLCASGAVRLRTSSGFMGYWGIFRESSIGNYRAFYGKASDCFLLRTKDGNKYVIGCQNPAEMVEYIKSKINQPQSINNI